MPELMRDFERPDDFRELVMSLHRRFPNGSFSEDVLDDVIVSFNVRDDLVEKGYLIEESAIVEGGEEKKYFYLGPKGVDLVTSWRIEDLTNKMVYLTILIGVFTLINVVVSLF